MVSAKDFIAYVLLPLTEAWGYIYGTAGRTWTEDLQQAWSQPGHKNWEQTKKYGAQWIGRKVCDCSGLLVWALKQLGETIVHQARYQYTDWCGAKGRLVNGCREDGKPILPGTAVFLKGKEDHIHHVGVYVGHGICVEAKGTRWGVVTSELSHWDYWGELKMIDYTDAARLENEPAPEVPKRPDDTLGRAMVDNPGAWLNVRSGPGTNYHVLFRLEKGDVVEILAVDEEKKWDQIRYGGRTGWASAEYLRILDEDQDETEDPDQEPTGSQDERIGEMIDMIRRMREEIDALSETLEKMEKRAKEMEEWR